MVRLPLVALLALAAAAPPLAAAAEEPPETLLLRSPTVSAEHVAFVHAADLWIAPRAGGEARRLTSAPGMENRPRFSPDGRWIAFTGAYEGNEDVYLLPVTGGAPRRLTHHPGDDLVCGWHPDGKRVLFLSGRDGGAPVFRPWLVSTDGGTPEPTAIPKATDAVFSPDGGRIAYTPVRDATRSWKRYRGGRTGPIWVFDPATLEVREAPHVNATDREPCWAGGTVFFTSDRDGMMNVWKWTPGEAEAVQVTRFTEYGAEDLSAGGGVLVFHRAGALHLLEPESGEVTRLRISCLDDGLARNPRWVLAADHLRAADPAPNGKRAVLEVRGEIVTVPREDGDPRVLTRTPGANDRDPAWSPKGDRIAWFSDGSGEYRLLVADPLGREEPRVLDLGGARFYHDLRWGPDGKRILFSDKANRIAFVDLESGKVTDVCTAQGSLGTFRPQARWSPDGEWIAFEQRDPRTTYDRICLHEVATGKTTPITDSFATADMPAFSLDGKLLFFAASVEAGPSRFGLDMSALASRDHEEELYVVVLKGDGENPLFPASDEGGAPEKKGGKKDEKEKDREEEEEKDPKDPKEEKEEGNGKESPDEGKGKKEGEKKEEKGPSIDLEGLDQRILALPGARGNFRRLLGGKNRLLVVEGDWDGGGTLKSYDLEKRKMETLQSGVEDVRATPDGETILFRRGKDVFLADAKAGSPKRTGPGDLRLRVDPAAEWPQILREVWRTQRDYFYDPNLHGVDWDAMWERWSVFLPHVRHRSDLDFLTAEMMGELSCGHEYLWGGERDGAPPGPGVGLLGADWEVADGRYRLRRIYRGQNWNPGQRAPLTEPGVDARVGDHLVSVDGRPVAPPGNLYAAFEGTSGRQVEIVLSAKADGSDPRTMKVVPVGSERVLRRLAWVEECRRRVDELSGGRLAYVYMPNTGGRGLASFERDFYSQLDREGLVLDERYNGGGKIAEHVIEILSREVLCWWRNRENWVGRSPFGTLQGPKVMIINESAGSGGDALPWMFRRVGLGPLVGTRTWGGLVGISGYPGLVDGGYVTSACFGVISPEGEWIVENEGVAPDHEVVEYPKDVAAGRDPQLEKAVELAMKALETFERVPEPEYRPPAPR